MLQRMKRCGQFRYRPLRENREKKDGKPTEPLTAETDPLTAEFAT